MATDLHDTHTAPLPTPGAGPQMRMIAVALIEESPHNPRKTFDPAKLQELADSIAASGVHQPILLRPLPASRVADTFAARAKNAPLPAFELVAGARRLRACKLAKVLEVPAMIRELTDSQALEIAIVENLQREDVSELEEAEGYEALMQHGELTVDAVGAKIGKSRSYVYARLKLLDLCQEGRRSLREGKIDASKALLLARIPDHALQIKALGSIESKGDGYHTLSYRDAAAYIQREYMLRLDAARFNISDSALIPGAGPCRLCPKRTGHAPELFADVNSADVCTDTKCYRAKEEAHSNNTKRDALARGQTIIDGREAKELMPSSWTSRVEGYLRLDDAADSPTAKPLRTLIGKAMEQAGVQATLIANPHQDGELVAVLLPAQVNELLKAQGHAEAADKVAGEAAQDAKQAAAQAKKDAAAEFEKAWRWNLLEATLKRLEREDVAPSDELLRHLAIGRARTLNTERAKRLCNLLGLGKVAPVAGIEQWARDHEPAEFVLQLLVMEADVEYRPWLKDEPDQNAGLLLVANEYGVDIEAIKAQTQANQRADAAKAKAQAQAKAAKAAQTAQTEAPDGPSTPPPAAQAGGVRGKGAGRKGTRPAARAATEQPYTSKAHASAQIASALQALEDQVQAPAAQSNEAPPVAAAQATPAPSGGAGVGADDGAASETAQLQIGTRVRILPTATGKKQLPHVGKQGTVERRLGDASWDVAIPRAKRGVPVFVGFHSSELEVVL